MTIVSLDSEQQSRFKSICDAILQAAQSHPEENTHVITAALLHLGAISAKTLGIPFVAVVGIVAESYGMQTFTAGQPDGPLH